MGWIAQEYEGNAHVVPDTEPDHVLAADCWCAPRAEQVKPWLKQRGFVITHRDEAQRILDAS